MAGIYGLKPTELSAFWGFFRRNGINVRDFSKRQIMIGETDSTDTICIIMSGSAYLAGVTESGRRTIADFYFPGDITGRYIFPSLSRSGFYYIASASSCRAAVMEYSRIAALAKEGSPEAGKIISALVASGSRLSTHAYIVGQRSLAEKLMLFFEHMSDKAGSDSFKLNISYTNLADYLAADRSAMMREIKKLNDTGMIHSDKLKITILKRN